MNIALELCENILLPYLIIVYIWSKVAKQPISEVESKLWSWFLHWFKANTTDELKPHGKLVPVQYAEQIHDAVKNFTGIGFDTTLWCNETYSTFHVPCFSMDLVPKSNNIDTDLPIIEVLALDRFRKCTYGDGLLASRIISDTIQGKVFLHILYASTEEEFERYNALLEREKEFADDIGLRNSVPIADNILTNELNLFSDLEGGDSHDQY